MFRYSVAHYLGALVLLIVTAPILSELRHGEDIDALILTLVMMSATIAVGRRRRTLLWSVVLIVPAIFGKWAGRFQPELVPAWLPIALFLIYISFVLVQLFSYILRAPRVDSEVVCAGIATYLTLGLYWAVLFVFVDTVSPGSFAFSGVSSEAQTLRGFTALYFSFATLATVGYDDIAPASGIARMLALVEAVVGIFYMAIMVARLVTLYPAHRPTGT